MRLITQREFRDNSAAVMDAVESGERVAVRHESGVFDSCVHIDSPRWVPSVLPPIPEITAFTLPRVHQGVAMEEDFTGLGDLVAILAVAAYGARQRSSGGFAPGCRARALCSCGTAPCG